MIMRKMGHPSFHLLQATASQPCFHVVAKEEEKGIGSLLSLLLKAAPVLRANTTLFEKRHFTCRSKINKTLFTEILRKFD